MITSSSVPPSDTAADDSLEFVSRLWLRTALLAWAAWLVPLGLTVAGIGFGR